MRRTGRLRVPCSLIFIIFTLKFHGSQPDFFTVGIGLKRQGQDGTSVINLTLNTMSAKILPSPQDRQKCVDNRNSPVAKRVEACVRNATAKHACIVWLDSQMIVCQPLPFLFFSSLMILACFAIAVRVHLGPIPVLLLANCEPYFSSSESEV